MLPKQKLYWLILFATIIRCVAALAVDLGNDEVYYLTYAQHLQWNYFDHPPMVALLIRITTFNLHFTNEFFVRLGPIIIACLNTFIIYHIASRIKNEEAGFLAALLFTASPYCSVIAGLFIMPDAPQLFFWLLSILILVNLVQKSATRSKVNQNLILFGITSGLCIMCKVHGIFLWFGLIVYIIFNAPKLLLNVYLYLSACLTAFIISPILIWNIQNKFITYNFHSSRVTINHGLNLLSFFRESLGGFLYNNPFNYILIVTALFFIGSSRLIVGKRVERLLLSLSLPLIIILLFISLFRDTLPHWSGPAYCSLILLAASRFQSTPSIKFPHLKFARAGNILLVTIIIAGVIMVNYYPGTLGKSQSDQLGNGDFTLDLYGWKDLRQKFQSIREQNIKAGVNKTTFIISDKWFPAAHIDNYVAQPLHLDFVAIGKPEDIHTYFWLNSFRKTIKKGDHAWYITSSANFSDPKIAFQNLFKNISKPVKYTQYRNGKPVRVFFFYLLKHYRY